MTILLAYNILAHDIRFLNPEQIKGQLEAVKDELALHAAVAILIYAGHPQEIPSGLTLR